jgi:hypothetical protein
VDSGVSEEEGSGRRRAPRLIKFKSRREREGERQSQELAEDEYTPKNTQATSKIRILKPYSGFEQPQFYQGPSWKFLRQSTKQNSQRKHYENGAFDQVQWGHPGEEELQSDGGVKLYPPLDESDDDFLVDLASVNAEAQSS